MGGVLADQLTEFLARGGELTVEGEELRFRGPKDARPLLQALRPFARQLAELLRLGEPVLEDGRLWFLPRHLRPDGGCAQCGKHPTTWWAYAGERLLRCSTCDDWFAHYKRDGLGQTHITCQRAGELRGLLEGRTPQKPPVLRATSPATNPVGVTPPANGRCPHCQRRPKVWWRYRGRPELYCACTPWEKGAVVEVVLP